MEEHAIIHLPMLTVTVPVGTQDPIAREQVATVTATTHSTYLHAQSLCHYTLTNVFHTYLQPVVPPVRMEEHATLTIHIFYTTFTVSVPAGTKDPTASTEVFVHTPLTASI